jgi:hypothetical protein
VRTSAIRIAPSALFKESSYERASPLLIRALSSVLFLPMRVTVMFDAGKHGVMTHKIVCPSPTYADMAPRVVANNALRWRAMFAARVEALAACLSERDRA